MTQTATLEPPDPRDPRIEPPATPVRPHPGPHRGLAGRTRPSCCWCTFVLIPIALTFALAFTNAKLVSPQPASFVGIDNFTRLFHDPVFWKSLRNTILFAIFVVPAAGRDSRLVLALLINVKVRGVNFFRTVYFLPVVTSIVVISMLWQFMYQPDGLINSFLRTISGGAIQGTDWLGNPNTALGAILFMSIWQGVGFHMVIWLSGLQTIPGDLYEASSLDGASTWQNFRYVTWPSLRQTRTFILVTITHLGVQPVHPGPGDDPGRTAGLHHHRRLPGGPRRVRAAANRLRLGDLAGLLRPGAGRFPGPALPHPRQGCAEMSDTFAHVAETIAAPHGPEQQQPGRGRRIGGLHRPDPALPSCSACHWSSCSCPR